MSALTDVRDELTHAGEAIREVFDRNLPAISAAAEREALSASDPLIQAAEAALGLPPAVREILAHAITAIAGEFVKETDALRAQIPAPAEPEPAPEGEQAAEPQADPEVAS